mmetsp:Transcript_2503/g.5326  ORF Transcript_2503/g.5326 Transcript_2503/m.5326 type:complete len:220 (+) Transcript_2503:103-762(+)
MLLPPRKTATPPLSWPLGGTGRCSRLGIRFLSNSRSTPPSQSSRSTSATWTGCTARTALSPLRRLQTASPRRSCVPGERARRRTSRPMFRTLCRTSPWRPLRRSTRATWHDSRRRRKSVRRSRRKSVQPRRRRRRTRKTAPRPTTTRRRSPTPTTTTRLSLIRSPRQRQQPSLLLPLTLTARLRPARSMPSQGCRHMSSTSSSTCPVALLLMLAPPTPA